MTQHLLVLVLAIALSLPWLPSNTNANDLGAYPIPIMDPTNLKTLRLVQVVMRHGDRNPIKDHPLCPYKEDDWLGGFAYLTERGERQTFELGQYLRKRYDGFLDGFYRPSELYALSSDTDRSIRSAISALRGLYPRLNSTTEYQTVPIRTIAQKEDNILKMSMKCPKYEMEFKNYLLTSEENLKWEKKGKDIMRAVTNSTEVLNKTIEQNLYLWESIDVMKYHKRTLPGWITPEVERFAADYVFYREQAETGDDLMKRLRTTIIQRLIENMDKSVEDHQNQNQTQNQVKNPYQGMRNKGGFKFRLFSGHDTSLISIMNILNTGNNLRPYYASSVILELHKDINNDDHHVKLFFRNDVTQRATQLRLPGCQKKCRRNLLSPDFEKICGASDPKGLYQRV